jgi:hypothetical protein
MSQLIPLSDEAQDDSIRELAEFACGKETGSEALKRVVIYKAAFKYRGYHREYEDGNPKAGCEGWNEFLETLPVKIIVGVARALRDGLTNFKGPKSQAYVKSKFHIEEEENKETE